MRAALALSLVLFASSARAVPLLDSFGGPMGYGEHRLPTGRGLSERVDLSAHFPRGVDFYRPLPPVAWVNTNGTVSFAGPVSSSPSPFPIEGQPMVAPWWADIDTTNGDGVTQNAIYWHLDAGRLIVTWLDVESAARDGLRNRFQMILTSPGCVTRPFTVEFRYARCEWAGDEAGGLAAQVGFDAGNRMDFVLLPMSRTRAITDVCTSSNLRDGEPGQWRFEVSRSVDIGVCPGFGQRCEATGEVGVCAVGVNACFGGAPRCERRIPAMARRCNGADNDCDGDIDTGDELCPAGEVCARDHCARRCARDAECSAGEVCARAGHCAPPACANRVCPEGTRCVDGVCAELCSTVTCPRGQACVRGACVDACLMLRCEDFPDTVCIEGECVRRCQCQRCAEGLMCRPDGRCEPATRDAGADVPDANDVPDASADAAEVGAILDAGEASDVLDASTPDMDVAAPTSPPAGRLVSGGCSCRAHPSSRGGLWIVWIVLLLASPRTEVRGRPYAQALARRGLRAGAQPDRADSSP